ncbi:MAG: RHS repeat-associated core domain-containing protein [Candidatus Hydrogenedentes bacterium]|nr:RHS repeat-associated core domain-containing protein [Candidatus Hydrogenedentota bacterium]
MTMDNLISKVAPWQDDFEDGNTTGWSGDTGSFSVSGGVLKNTLDTSVWRLLYLSETDADHDLRFDYIRYSTTGTAQNILRYTDSNNMLYLEVKPTKLILRQFDGGTLTTLDTFTTTVGEDTWYDVRAVLDGANVTVYWGEQGADFDEVMSTSSATETTTARAATFRAGPNSEHGWDNVHIVGGTSDTIQVFAYNNANEQTSMVKGGVTTTMIYDAWGNLTSKTQGSYSATYAYRYGGKLYSVTSDFPGESNVTYETGGDEKRRSRVAGTNGMWYNWDGSSNLVSEESDADGTSGSLVRTYIEGGLAHVTGGTPAIGDWRYYTLDHLGSTRGVWKQDKAAFATFEYSPYGNLYAIAGSVGDVSHRYTGHRWDDAAETYLSSFRPYSPVHGRWLSRDPLGMVDGPNLYGYVGANPVNYFDARGFGKGSEAYCAKVWESLRKLQKTLARNIRDLMWNPNNLPLKCPGGCKPGQSKCCQSIHNTKGLPDTNKKLEKKRKNFDKYCRDRNGRFKHPPRRSPPRKPRGRRLKSPVPSYTSLTCDPLLTIELLGY